MTTSPANDGSEECSDPERVGASSTPSREVDPADRGSRRAVTDGGQAQEAEDEDEAAEQADDEDAEAAEDESEEAEDEEAEEAAEDEAEEAEPEEEAEDGEGDGEDEETADEGDEEAEPEDEEGEDEEGEEEEYHVEDAEDVYQDEDVSSVLHLDLDGLFLDLLGLEVNLNPVTLDVSARPGENNLLGNLLSAVTGLLDGSSAVTDTVKSLLGKPKELLGSFPGKLKEFFGGLLRKPREFLGGLFGGAEEGEADEEEVEGEEAPEEEATGNGRLSSAAGWLKQKLIGLIPGFPIEELVAAIVREVIETLLERVEPEGEETNAQSEATSQTEA
ncbi:hypothetical protein [Natronococcus wangiae]|uniref:hypothetical protein n=1 Tax=Natronococcus wangiae TaxID=3068275 RepID=UPI00273F6C9B|nr:hypothetical protein [Natronococcus sp. AD5]